MLGMIQEQQSAIDVKCIDNSGLVETVQALQREGVQCVFREGLHDHVLTAAEVALAMTDVIALRAKLAGVSEADYRLFQKARGVCRCRAINRLGKRCGNEKELDYAAAEWVWWMQAGGYCDSHADRRMRRNARKPISSHWLEAEQPKVAGDNAMPKASGE